MRNIFKPVLATLIAGISIAAHAQAEAGTASAAATATPPAVTQQIPKALQMAMRGGVKVGKSFDAVSGLKGWVLTQPDGQPTIVYSTADGKYVMAGALIDENGKNLSAMYADTQIPRPDFSTLEKSPYFIEGPTQNPKAIVYAFMDPNCIFCHLEWKAFQPYIKQGLQVRWIPVAFLKPDSAGKAAALLESKTPAALMQQLQTKFNAATESGGITPLANPSVATMAKIQSNGELMRGFHFSGTPALVYKDSSGKVQYHPGMVRLSELPGITNIPAQPNTDPELKRFE